jgi:tripartite-type tricarboxylate transporter receptor subunit TctC
MISQEGAMAGMRIVVVIVAALSVAISSAVAQNWPTRTMTLVVPFAAGGSSDAVGRIVADGIGRQLNQTVIVENVTGAGGMTGSARVAKAAPDGYQFVIGNVGPFAQGQWLYKPPLYDAVKAFAPVGLITDESLVLVTRNDFPANNLQEFMTYAKANQSKMQFDSSGVGGSNHLACLLLNSRIGIEVTHVPYRNVVQSMQDLIAGRVDYECLSLPLALPQIKGKTLKALAILSQNRSANLPDLPSADEQGLAGFDAPSWYALFLPAGTPPAIVRTLNSALVSVLDTPAMQERLKQLGGDVVAPDRRSPEYLAQFVAAEVKKWEGPIKASGVQLE